MLLQRAYLIAFLFSLMGHGLILMRVANLNMLAENKKRQKIEVGYIRTVEPVHKAALNKLMPAERLQRLPSKIAAEKIPLPHFSGKENVFMNTVKNIRIDSNPLKPSVTKPDVISIKKRITMPAIEIDKIKNPSYIGYYQIVREKIRRAAYQNYTRTETGEAYLSFVISGDGALKEVRLVEEKSPASQYLREIALRSIREATPFPVFPKELDYPQLSFNVVISFEIEQ